jgi:hypothetical protein
MSLIGGNCKQSTTNIMLIPPNDIMLDFNLCNFKCIVASKMQLTVDILWIIMNWMLHRVFIIMLGLFILVCVSIENLNKRWIVIPFIIKATFTMHVAIWSFCLFLIF